VTKVKICGIIHAEHGLASLEAGADLLGFIFYPQSHRYIDARRAGEVIARCRARFGDGWKSVGVFVNVPLDEVNRVADQADLDVVQLAGEEDPEYCRRVCRPVIKVIRVRRDGGLSGPVEAAVWNAERILLDTERAGHFGGTGEAYDWRGVREHARDAILAGGLTPANIAVAIHQAQPWGVDVSSGVERDKRKDLRLIRQLLSEVKPDVGAR